MRKNTYKSIGVIFLGFVLLASNAIAEEIHEFEMTLCDVFEISESDDWNVEVERYLMLRLADVMVTPRRGYDFSMKLFFKADTEDLAQFDTPEKIEGGVRRSTENYLPYVVEKKIELNPVPLPQSFGYYTVITDAKWADAQKVPSGEYRFMTRGMYRTSQDTALGFSIMTNDVSSDNYMGLLAFVFGFLKDASSHSVPLAQRTCGA